MTPRLLLRGAAWPGPLLFGLLALATACDQPPSADSLQQWTKADHHSNDDSKLGSVCLLKRHATKLLLKRM